MSRTVVASILLALLLAAPPRDARADAPESGQPAADSATAPATVGAAAADLLVRPDGSVSVGHGAEGKAAPASESPSAPRPQPRAVFVPKDAPPAARHALVTRSLVLFVHAQGVDYGRPLVERALEDHAAWVHHLEENGLTLLAGAVVDDPRVESAIVLPWPDEAAARRFVASSPGIERGVLVPEIHPWLAEFDRVAAGAAGRDDARVMHALGFLVKGPAWGPGDSPDLRALQDAHLAHLRSLGADGLVLAGPLLDDGWKRGVVVFRGVKLDDARDLEEADPAVRAGRLRLLLMQWSLPAGSFSSD
jgi:uncharacterized protein YciI